ncbi:MAG: hypothetical protein BWY77_01042 [bacterium ADurb.Bin431]|nr:MAG: hypothetical protein BWY77_01042 [bacterium ADurb.Bin431]
MVIADPPLFKKALIVAGGGHRPLVKRKASIKGIGVEGMAYVDLALARRARAGDGAQIPAGVNLGISDAMTPEKGDGLIDGKTLGNPAQVDPGEGVGEGEPLRTQTQPLPAGVEQGLPALFRSGDPHDLPAAEPPQPGEGADGRGESPGTEAVDVQGRCQHRRHLGSQQQNRPAGMGVQPADLALRMVAAGEGIDLLHPRRSRIDERGRRIAAGRGRIELDRDVGIHQKEGFLYGRDRVPSA